MGRTSRPRSNWWGLLALMTCVSLVLSGTATAQAETSPPASALPIRDKETGVLVAHGELLQLPDRCVELYSPVVFLADAHWSAFGPPTVDPDSCLAMLPASDEGMALLQLAGAGKAEAPLAEDVARAGKHVRLPRVDLSSVTTVRMAISLGEAWAAADAAAAAIRT
ncbi:hypothetical protein ACSDQ9_01510 [Aestuariimicrobium soli]|uniref:hypothetical protein n=1 Tax=Aestuariimicrobium soli TaxID=2035834 RepID=UPI003EBD4715